MLSGAFRLQHPLTSLTTTCRFVKVGQHTVLKQNMYTIEEGEPSVFERETSKSVLAAQAAKQKMLFGAQRAGRDYDHQVCTVHERGVL